MATIVLGTVGRIFGGPIGGLVGAAVGGLIDRSLQGGGATREVGRVGNLAIQSATYGEPIPLIMGRMRAAGNLIWTAGIRETATTSGGGGGKRSGPATTNYRYSASFAVGLAGRRITGVGRIWADGKLIRDEFSGFLAPAVMRLHDGSDDQDVDPLIAAAEAALVPAYRGLAYAVFEDLPLGDYGNRIPNLTFEIIADDAGIDAGQAVVALSEAAGVRGLSVSGSFPALAGYYAGRAGSLADALAPLLDISSASIITTPQLGVTAGQQLPVAVADVDTNARRSGENRSHERRRQTGMDRRATALELTYFDTSRDYQPGLQRARRPGDGAVDQRSIAAAMGPDQAKSLCIGLLASSHAAGVTATIRLPWRHVALRPGMTIKIAGNDDVWRIRESRFEAFVVNLDVERLPPVTQPLARLAPQRLLARAGDGGRALAFDDVPIGPTMVALLDLPGLGSETLLMPRLWVAAAGASPAWRRAAIRTSVDDGASYAALGLAETGTVMGRTANALMSGPTHIWDRFSTLDVELLAPGMWLESRSEASVLAGANLAMVGGEIIQFATAEAISDRRFRLYGLLRGRRGTESAVADHGVDENFVLLDSDRLLAFDPPLDVLGHVARVQAEGAGDIDPATAQQRIGGRALQPLQPAHLRFRWVDDDIIIAWVRRSRMGYAWIDFVDAPLAEITESYLVTISLDGRPARSVTIAETAFVYTGVDRIADGDGSLIEISVRQISGLVGPGQAATAHITHNIDQEIMP